MEKFVYKARTKEGKIVNGSIKANNEAAVMAHIREQDMMPTSIKMVAKNEHFWSKYVSRKITLYDISVLCRQFATLVGAGVSLINALYILVDQTENPKLKSVLQEVAKRVNDGKALSAALATYPDVFPELMVNMIAAGETGGMLETVLTRLANQYEKDYRLNAKIKSAMTYPAVVIVVAMIVVAVVLTFVMPTYAELFKQLNSELPWPTLVVIAISNWMRQPSFYVTFFVVIIGGYLVYNKFLVKSKEFRLWRDKAVLKVPVFGQLLNKVIITRFASTFAGLSRSGVPILTALTVVSRATGSLAAQKVLEQARNNISRGKGLAEPMEASGLFPPMVTNMVTIGEETGNLDYMLDKIAEFYTGEVDDMTNRLSALLEPFLIVILGFIVGFIAVAMLLPMFDIVTKIGNL